MGCFRRKKDKLETETKPKKPSWWSKRTKLQKLIIVAFCGYIAGVIATLCWFLFLTTQLRVPISKSSWICCFLALFLTLGLAFSKNMQCIGALILPNICSVKGRSFLIAYSFVLVTTGPFVNIMSNVRVLSTSLTCGQEQLKEAVVEMLEMVKRPLVAIKRVVAQVIKDVKRTLQKIEKVLKHMRDLITDILEDIKKAFSWLASIVNMCNKQIGTPFERCVRMVEEARKDCEEQLGILGFLCNVTYIMDVICYSVKVLDYVCILIDFVSDAIVGKVNESLQHFTESIKNMFYVSVTFDHDFHFETKVSKSMDQVREDILRDLEKNSTIFFLILKWAEILASVMFLRVFFKALRYRRKYLTSDRFDNRYITQEFIDLDERRKKMGKDNVLPLTRKETSTYIMITSCSLVQPEKMKIARSAVFLIISTIQIFSVCLVDYSIYWFLSLLRFHGRKMGPTHVGPIATFNVTGEGFTADIYRDIIKAFDPELKGYDSDIVPCLPNPKPVNYNRYFEIGTILFFCWTFMFLEPYFMRLRQIIMRSFYPDRAKERAVWLFNQINANRASYVKQARRISRKKYLMDDTSKESYTCIEWLRAKTDRFWIMRKILGEGKMNHCMLCGSHFRSEEDKVLCPRPGCKGMFCHECFTELNNLCFICREPLEYGDTSDVSEEKDSSDELEVVTHSRKDHHQE